MLLGGGATGSLRGELRFTADGSRLRGTIWLQNSEAPVQLSDVRMKGAAIGFTAPADGRLRFTGELRASTLRGIASADSGAPRIWTAAPLSPGVEYYPVLPLFTLRQVIAGRGGLQLRLPGPWVAAARAAAPDADSAGYARLAAAAGIAELRSETLASVAPLRAMGVARRAELAIAARATLAAMRAQMPASESAAFDRIFRPRGAWRLDLHDAALAEARAGSPALTLDQAAPALVAIGLAPADPEPEAIALALYRLHALAAHDSAGIGELRSQMHRASPASASAVDLLLRGYASGAQWHVSALRFLLTARWIADVAGPRSVADLMAAAWRGATDSAPVPVIQPRVFGYPQAIPRYGVSAVLFDRVITAENWSAEQWLQRHGRSALLESLQLMASDLGEAASIEAGGETFRLTSVQRQSTEATNGFLEPRDAIQVDPGYTPLLALGAVVHEWQHLVFERQRRDALRATGEIMILPATDPFIAEGLAEWRTERLLAPLAERFPLLGLGEIEKRRRLGLVSGSEQHVLGYAMVRALAAVIPDERRLLALLLSAAADPRAVVRAPEVRRAWARFGGPEVVISAPSRRVLIPETRFTIEDRFPDVTATRILIPASGGP